MSAVLEFHDLAGLGAKSSVLGFNEPLPASPIPVKAETLVVGSNAQLDASSERCGLNFFDIAYSLHPATPLSRAQNEPITSRIKRNGSLTWINSETDSNAFDSLAEVLREYPDPILAGLVGRRV